MLFILATCTATLVRHQRLLKADVVNTFKSRNELIDKFVELQRNRVAIMANVLLNEYQSRPLPAASPLELQQHPAPGFWQLTAPKPALGTITGMSQQRLTPEIEREIQAVLVLDAQIKPVLELDKDLIRAYFLSADHFIYMAPVAGLDNFHFTPELYRHAHWLEAVSATNNEHSVIISGPYKDSVSSNWIMTLAQPVYAGDQFLGIVGLDIRIETLEQLANVSTAIGESWLLDENSQVIARQKGYQPGLTVRPPLTAELSNWQEDNTGDLWLSSPVLKDELWLGHRLTRAELYWAVARESAGILALVVILSLLAVISLHLRKTLEEVTRLTRVDSLTKALNRRGFYEEAARAIAIAQRRKSVLGVLMLDIDFFKKINDTYGHAEGDSVLKQLGDYLNHARRPYDIFCRWGGEEFLLMLSLERAEDALPVAERMRSEAQRTTIQKDNTSITLSGGLILMGADEPLEDAIKRADELLYQSKQAGRNRITFEKNE